MQLKPALPTKTAARGRRRLLIGIGVVALVLVASVTSLAFALTPDTPDMPSGSDQTALADPGSNGSASGGASGDSDGSLRLASYQLADRPTGSSERPAGSTETGGSGAPPATDSTYPTGSGEEAGSTSPSQPASVNASGATEGFDIPFAAAAADDETTTTTSTTSPAPKITTVKNAAEASSWADLRGNPPSTTTTVQTVSGYAVVEGVGAVSGSPAVDAFDVGGLDIFVQTAEQIYWGVMWYGDTWPEGALGTMPDEGGKPGDGSWEGEGEDADDGARVSMAPGSGPASVAWSTGYTDVFVRGADDALYHRRGTTTWSDWENLGGLLSSDPAVASRGPGLLDVFVRGPFDQLWHLSFNGSTWSEWENLGGDLKSEPAAVAMDNGHMDLFARGQDDALWHMSWSAGAGWSAWESLGGVLTSGPGVCSLHPGRLDVFVRGSNRTLWQRTWMLDQCAGFRKWMPWQDLGGSPIASSPDAAAWGGNRIDVFVRGTNYDDGTDTALWHRWWDGYEWLPRP